MMYLWQIQNVKKVKKDESAFNSLLVSKIGETANSKNKNENLPTDIYILY